MAPDPERRVSLSHWLIVGGMGPPPSAASLLRMSSERKARYREENGFNEERKKALAEFEQQWGPAGFAGLGTNVFGSNKRNKLSRDEVMKTYGPGGSKRKNITETYTVNKPNRADDEGADAAGGVSGDADAAGTGGDETADTAGAGGATGDGGVSGLSSAVNGPDLPMSFDGYTNSDPENLVDRHPSGSSAVQLQVQGV
ncbi:hypothetical protein DL768_000461 [Monosporascus sp. mg162]|nr:hypothetical protein DL768_000461 [Monosporascus sp. mg162]